LVDLCGRQQFWLTKAGGANGTAIAYLDCSIRKPPKRFASQFSFGLRNRKGLCDASPDSSSSSLSAPCTRHSLGNLICVDWLLNPNDFDDILRHQTGGNEVWFRVGVKLWNICFLIRYRDCLHLWYRLSFYSDRLTRLAISIYF